MVDIGKTEGAVRPFSYPEVAWSNGSGQHRTVEQLGHVPLTLAAVAVGRPTSVHQVASWSVGDIIELDRAPTDPVDLRLNNRFIGRGHILVDDDELSVRVGDLADVEVDRG
jgi:flagellar motor switch/type III secretory pathway protein FliN